MTEQINIPGSSSTSVASLAAFDLNNPLVRFFASSSDRSVHKWLHYFDVYHQYFNKFRGQETVNILEIGVQNGGSLQMWREYFGVGAKIWGVDVDPNCKAVQQYYKDKYGDENIQVIIGDQGDRSFLETLKKTLPPLDIVIDDGGHYFHQQINSFEVLYPLVKPGGVYLVEDVHTSYWDNMGGGTRKPGTFIEYAKIKLDELNAWHAPDQPGLTDVTNTTYGISFYDSIVVFTKKNPRQLQQGPPRTESRLKGVVNGTVPWYDANRTIHWT